MVTATDIQVRTLPAGPIAYQQFRGTIASIESVTSGVHSWVVTMGFKPTGPMAVEIAGEPTADLSHEYDMEIQLPVEARAHADPSDRVQIKQFEQTDAVVMTLRGAWDLMNLAEPLGRMNQWMLEQKLQHRPVVRWVEVTDPTKVSIDEQTTELQYLVPAR